MSRHYQIIDISCTGLALPKHYRRNTEPNWSKFRTELGGKLSYHQFRIESKEDLEIVAAILDTFPKDSSNLSYPLKIVQEKNA